MTHTTQGGDKSAFEQLNVLIADIIGADAAEIIDIQPNSRFVDDLGMDSIQIVVLVERGNALYEGRIDFSTWLKDRSFSDLAKLTVGDVADFIEQSLNANKTGEQ